MKNKTIVGVLLASSFLSAGAAGVQTITNIQYPGATNTPQTTTISSPGLTASKKFQEKINRMNNMGRAETPNSNSESEKKSLNPFAGRQAHPVSSGSSTVPYAPKTDDPNALLPGATILPGVPPVKYELGKGTEGSKIKKKKEPRYELYSTGEIKREIPESESNETGNVVVEDEKIIIDDESERNIISIGAKPLHLKDLKENETKPPARDIIPIDPQEKRSGISTEPVVKDTPIQDGTISDLGGSSSLNEGTVSLP